MDEALRGVRFTYQGGLGMQEEEIYLAIETIKVKLTKGSLQVCFQQRACTNAGHKPTVRSFEWMRARSL